MIAAWQKAFRDGLAPNLSTAGLEALAVALEQDDKTLIQGATTSPPPLESLAEWPIEGACPIAFACWKGGAEPTVAGVEEAFSRVCAAADVDLGEPAAVRFFMNWWDDGDRGEMRTALLAEVRRELAIRRPAPIPAA